MFCAIVTKQHTAVKKKDVISEFSVLQGSAETLIRRGGKLQRLSIAYFSLNIPANNC